MKTRGQLIKEARLNKCLSQEQVADAAKLTQQAYSNIENDKTDQPRRSALKAIAKILEIQEDALFTLRMMPSKQAMDVAREYDCLPSHYQARILHTTLEAKSSYHT